VFCGDGAVETESDSEVEDRPDGQNTTLKLDDWVVFRVDAETAHLALQLRQKWQSVFLRRMRAPAKPWSEVKIMYIYIWIAVAVHCESGASLKYHILTKFNSLCGHLNNLLLHVEWPFAFVLW
jgi:hypothetical protein